MFLNIVKANKRSKSPKILGGVFISLPDCFCFSRTLTQSKEKAAVAVSLILGVRQSEGQGLSGAADDRQKDLDIL